MWPSSSFLLFLSISRILSPLRTTSMNISAFYLLLILIALYALAHVGLFPPLLQPPRPWCKSTVTLKLFPMNTVLSMRILDEVRRDWKLIEMTLGNFMLLFSQKKSLSCNLSLMKEFWQSSKSSLSMYFFLQDNCSTSTSICSTSLVPWHVNRKKESFLTNFYETNNFRLLLFTRLATVVVIEVWSSQILEAGSYSLSRFNFAVWSSTFIN